MKPTNPHSVAVGTMFTVHGKNYKVIDFGYRDGESLIVGHLTSLKMEEIWLIKPLGSGSNFIMSKKELDRKLKKYKQENKHLLWNG